MRDDPGEIAAAAERTGQLALDTEFMGEGRYRTLLCLVQLAVPVGSVAEPVQLLDPLREELDGEPLARVLADPEVELVVHAGRQDIALLRRSFGGQVRNVFDTQVAAGFVGLPAQGSYELLLGQILGVRVAKSASFTRWDRRPLSEEQLAYAREDVLHLLELAEEIKRRLRELGRLEWAHQECEVVEAASDERVPMDIFLRLPRVRSLRGPAQGVALELVEWRERVASERDRPVQSVLADSALVEIAKRRPSSAQQLHSIRGLNPGNLRRGGTELLEIVRRGSERIVELDREDERLPAPDPAYGPLISLSEAMVRARTREAGLAYELVASRADLQAIVTAQQMGLPEPKVRTLRGWRRELVGAELLEMLDGHVSLRVAENGIRIDRL